MRKGGLAWFGLLLMAEILAVLILVPNAWLRSVGERDHSMASSAFSAQSVQRIDGLAGDWYRHLIRDTGVEAEMYAFAGREPDGEAPRRKAPDIDSRGLVPYFEARVDAAIMVLYRAIWRASAALVWAPFAALLLIPSVADGITSWRIRQHGFRYASPLAHRYAWRAQGATLILCLFALLLPIPLPPVITPFAMVVVAVALVVSLANMPKRI